MDDDKPLGEWASGKAELDTLFEMAKNWKKMDMSEAVCDGSEKYLWTDFLEKLFGDSSDLPGGMYPYIKRLMETGNITEEEKNEFMQRLTGLSDDMHRELRLSRREHRL